jgi:two-component system sensor histidine kinase SenX3
LKAGPEGKDFAFVEVTDTGIGIPADKVEKVFDRFFRVDPSRNKKTGGSGLGLAICKAVVEAQGGTISVSSEEGRGSTFRFVIPRGESSPQAKATSPPQKFI